MAWDGEDWTKRSMMLSTSSMIDGPRSRSNPAKESDRETPDDAMRPAGWKAEQGDSLRSLLKSSLLRPASESRLRPRWTSRGPQVSDMESSEETSEKEPEEGTSLRTAGEREMSRQGSDARRPTTPFSKSWLWLSVWPLVSRRPVSAACCWQWKWFCWEAREGGEGSSRWRRGGLGGACSCAMNTGMEMVVFSRPVEECW
ncbi:hypothetical protein EYF80_013005 [Liparis tanakae]|uniref:Uncharacterized protein n=1 Tax=Liparis tanakae TaxID=230148 RepID=A0A4Z2IFL4_9TELE|nr:hypothetical protein EYF80_013005 [Liparis tanakae]